MGDTYLRVLSFNTHLFGNTFESWMGAIVQTGHGEFLIYKDEDRKHQLIHYLSKTPPLIDLFVLQEVWSGTFARDFKDDLASTYPSFFSRNEPEKGEFNKSGLCLEALQGISFADTGHTNYDGEVASQDSFAHKGFVFATASLDHTFDAAIPSGTTIPFGVIGTHMITNQGTYIQATTAAYKALNSKFQDFAQASLPGLLLGDLNTPERNDPTSEFSSYVYGCLYNFGNMPVTISEEYIDSRPVGYQSAVVPVMCYLAADAPVRYAFTIDGFSSTSGWNLVSMPFYVPAGGTGPTPVYQYSRTLPSGAGNDYRLSTQSTPDSGWTPAGVAFKAVESSTANALAIYEWTSTSADGSKTYYGYFPTNASMPQGWTMGNLAFYAIGFIQSDPGFTIDSTRNNFWPKVNLPIWEQQHSESDPDQERIDFIFHTAPANAATTVEVVYAGVLEGEPALRADGYDLSDHFPLFAILKISDARIASTGVVPVLCSTYNGRYLFATVVTPRSTGWQLVCAPFFVPAQGGGQTPVYTYSIGLQDGYYFRLSTDPNLQMSGWTRNVGPSFSAVASSTPGAVPVYEWTSVQNGTTLYAYFPSDTGALMLPSWTMGNTPAFYGVMRGTVA